MADTFTPNYNLVLPGIGGDVNTWGTLLNGNFSAIDTGMAANLDLAGTRTMTGPLKLTLASPFVQLHDSSQTLPAGLWRTLLTSLGFQINRNTANAGDFSTSTTPFYLDLTDNAHFSQSIAAGTSVSAGTSISATTTITAGGIVNGTPEVNAGTSSYSGEVHHGFINNTLHSYFFQSPTGGSIGLFDVTNNLIRFTTDTAGNFIAAGNVTAFSDERLKCEWQDVPHDVVEMAAQATAGTYKRKDTGERQAGVIAQEWLTILGEAVGLDDVSGLYTMAYGNAALVLACALARRVVMIEAQLREELK